MILLILLLIIGIITGWWYLSGTYEAALTAAKAHSDTMGVQFLDGSVIRNGFRVTRIRGGSLALIQKFRFEFTTTGEQRYSGYTELLGKRVLKMELEPHKIN